MSVMAENAKSRDANEAGQDEPSMEEILASIRRIISDDEDAVSPPTDGAKAEDAKKDAPKSKETESAETVAQEPEKKADSKKESGVLELTQMVKPPKKEVAKEAVKTEGASKTLETQEDMSDKKGQAVEAKKETTKPEAIVEVEKDENLVDEKVHKAAVDQISSLTETLSKTRRSNVDDMKVSSGDNVTLELIVREALKPVLAEWLEQNLEAVIERVVQKEIRRLVRDAQD